ncbi:MAG: ATP/GTP-binding protein [Burkholderiales bacterium]|nr:ATP/GTP-binding protein [Burkholderiales bacterium]
MATISKLVFAGPVGSGKTTAIQSLSDIEVVSTEARASDDVRRMKSSTTVAMDYGLMKLANGDQVRLYGTPGQKRFDFMWDILTENALGLVLMIRGIAVDPVADLRLYVNEFRDFIDRTSLVVGITPTGRGGLADTPADLRRAGAHGAAALRHGHRCAQPRRHVHADQDHDLQHRPLQRRRTMLRPCPRHDPAHTVRRPMP